MTVSRDLLVKAFPDNPRLRAQLEAALNLVDDIGTQAASVQAQLDSLSSQIGAGDFQAASDLLTAISNLSSSLGAIEIIGGNQVDTRGIDATDQASLLTRGTAYDTFVGRAGKGITGLRPTVPSNVVAIYFDTTLAAGGKPIFNYQGTGWVDSSGASV